MWTITPYQPSRRLANVIQLYWIGQVFPGSDLPVAYLPPTGYAAILLQYGKNPLKLRNHGSGWAKVSDAVILGQYFRYLEVDIPDCFEMIGVLIKPSVLHRYFGFNMDELTHRVIPADHVLGVSIAALVDRLRNEPSPTVKLSLVDEYFIDLFKYEKYKTGIVDNALAFMHYNKGNGQILELCKTFNCSPRLLQKKFKEIIGVSPKYVGRVVQFNNVLNSLKNPTESDWAAIAVWNGYYDQSHLISSFIEFTGASPVQYTHTDNDITKFYLDSYTQE